jgi:hypothetical protein
MMENKRIESVTQMVECLPSKCPKYSSQSKEGREGGRENKGKEGGKKGKMPWKRERDLIRFPGAQTSL